MVSGKDFSILPTQLIQEEIRLRVMSILELMAAKGDSLGDKVIIFEVRVRPVDVARSDETGPNS